MFQSPVSFKTFLRAGLFGLGITIAVVIYSFLTSRSFIAFCDVGQGDAIYIRIDNRIDILVDAGPDTKVLTCLGEHMPLYDRTIEYAFITHPHYDHYGGFIHVASRYRIERMYTSPIQSTTSSYQKLMSFLQEHNTSINTLIQNKSIRFSHAHITCLWPSMSYITKNAVKHPSSSGPERYDALLDPNTYSLVLFFQINKKRIILTGDILSNIENMLLHQNIANADILKIPHHGSKNGLSKQFLLVAHPGVSVISAGKNNSFGHPSPETLTMLKALNIPVRRTDKEGTILFKLE